MVSDQQRMLFIDLVQNKKIPIREADEITNIGYENAKVIKSVYKKDGRDFKISQKNKNQTKRSLKKDQKATMAALNLDTRDSSESLTTYNQEKDGQLQVKPKCFYQKCK